MEQYETRSEELQQINLIKKGVCFTCGQSHQKVTEIFNNLVNSIMLADRSRTLTKDQAEAKALEHPFFKNCCINTNVSEQDREKLFETPYTGISSESSVMTMNIDQCRCRRRLGKYLNLYNRVRPYCGPITVDESINNLEQAKIEEEQVRRGNEQALNMIGLTSLCCRSLLLTPHIVPILGTMFNPEVSKGIISAHAPLEATEPTGKWKGNMLRSKGPSEQFSAGIPYGAAIDTTTTSTSTPGDTIEEFKKYTGLDRVPPGYRFKGWFKLDQEGPPVYVADIEKITKK